MATSLFDRAAYRVRQLRRSLRPRVDDTERDRAREILGPQLFPLFDSMQATDQRHCLDVYKRLTDTGCNDAEVLTAALIHDAGKGRIAGARFGVHHRILYTAIERWPQLVNATAQVDPGMRALKEHDARTLALAREYGASPGVVALLEGTDPRAPALKAADDWS